MKYEDFALLSAEEQAAVYIDQTEMDNITAERNSLQAENESLKTQLQELREDNRKTKEMNYTLTRRLPSDPVKTAEDILNDCFK